MSGWFSLDDIDKVLQQRELKALQAAGSARLERLRSNYHIVIDEIIRQHKPVLPLVSYSEVTRSKPFETHEQRHDDPEVAAVHLVTGLKVFLPFTGDRKLFFVKGSTSAPVDYLFEPSIGQKDDFITLLIKEDFLTSELVDRHLFTFHQDVEKNLHILRRDIEAWVPTLREKVTATIDARRERLSNISELEESLSMPVRRPK